MIWVVLGIVYILLGIFVISVFDDIIDTEEDFMLIILLVLLWPVLVLIVFLSVWYKVSTVITASIKEWFKALK